MTATIIASTCPDCAEIVPITLGLRVTSIVICPSCQEELEIISLDPVEFALAPEIEEDFGE
jgi:alpha-aminoadipate carrier protein LysW